MADVPETTRAPGHLLRDPELGPYLAGKLVSACGMWIQNLGSAVLMYELTSSALMVGTVSIAQFLPAALFALYAGALTDRVDRRRLLIVGRTVAGASVLLIAVLITAFGVVGFGGAPVLLALVFVAGVGWTLSNPAQQALLPALVPPRDLETALAMNASAPSIARTIGPAIGAVLLTAGPTTAFWVAGTAHLGFALALAVFVGAHRRVAPPERPSLWGGLAYLRDDRKALRLMLAVVFVAIGADPVITLSPSLADALGQGNDAVGFFVSSFGGGAVLFALSVRRVRRWLSLRRVGVAGFWLTGLGLAIVGVANHPRWAMAGFAIAGAGFMMGSVSLNTRIQRRVPDEVRGRVMGLWGMAFLGSRPLGAALNGWMADRFNVRGALLVTAILMLGASLLPRVRYAEPPPSNLGPLTVRP